MDIIVTLSQFVLPVIFSTLLSYILYRRNKNAEAMETESRAQKNRADASKTAVDSAMSVLSLMEARLKDVESTNKEMMNRINETELCLKGEREIHNKEIERLQAEINACRARVKLLDAKRKEALAAARKYLSVAMLLERQLKDLGHTPVCSVDGTQVIGETDDEDIGDYY